MDAEDWEGRKEKREEKKGTGEGGAKRRRRRAWRRRRKRRGEKKRREGKEGIWPISRDKRWEMVRWISSSNTHRNMSKQTPH